MSRPVLAEPPAKRHRAEGEKKEKNGKAKKIDKEDEFRQLTAVSAVQEELNVLDEEEAHKVLVVHKAYLKRKRPLYARRQETIAKVPDFWLKVLLAYPLTQPYVSDCDQFALSFLEAISVGKACSVVNSQLHSEDEKEEDAGNTADAAGNAVEGEKGKAGKGSDADDDDDDDDDDGVAFRVTFTFMENPFFWNKQLWKEWESPEAQQAAFSEVNWKDSDDAKDLQSCLLWNLDPTTVEESDTPSFFSIFCEDVEDYEMGEALRGEIMDNPLDIYLRHDFEEVDEEEAAQEVLVPQEALLGNGDLGAGEGAYLGEDDLHQAEDKFEEGWEEPLDDDKGNGNYGGDGH